MTEAENHLLEILNWKLPCPLDGLVLVRAQESRRQFRGNIGEKEARQTASQFVHKMHPILAKNTEDEDFEDTGLDIPSQWLFVVMNMQRQYACKPPLSKTFPASAFFCLRHFQERFRKTEIGRVVSG